MSEKKEDAVFDKAISYCAKATSFQDTEHMVENLALGLKFFIEGMKRRQTQPANSLFTDSQVRRGIRRDRALVSCSASWTNTSRS